MKLNTETLLLIDRQKVRKHWGKSNEEVEENINTIKIWLKTQIFPEIPTDHMLEFFLTNCKHNIENTKKYVKTYYLIRTLVPEVYKNSNPKLPEMQDVWDMGCYIPLPNPSEGLYRISIFNLNPNAKVFDIYKYFANLLNIFEIRICEDLVLGEICVVDYSQLKWRYLFQFTPFFLKKSIFLMENLAKNRIKQIHIVQSPSYVNTIVNMAKKILKKKMADRIQIHCSFDTLYDYVPKELLPKDYGGTQPPLKVLVDMWKRKLQEYQDRFDMLDRTLEK